MTDTEQDWLRAFRVAVILLFAVFFVLLVLAGAKSFELTYQAWDLWRGGDTPVTAFATFNPHAMRFVIYYPIFLVSEISGLPVDMVFSFLCVALLALLCATMNAIDGYLDDSSWTRSLLYAVMFFGLALVMNGRLIIAFAGFALIILAFVKCLSRREWSARGFTALVTGLLLTSVSSGTLSVGAFFAALACGWILTRRDIDLAKATKLHLLASVALTIAAFSVSLTIGTLLNVEYFGGGMVGLVAMLDHGVGRFFLKFGPPGAVAVLTIAVCAVILSIGAAWRLPTRPALLVLATLPVALGGLYGISTLVVGIVPLALALRPSFLADFAEAAGFSTWFQPRNSRSSGRG